MQVPNVLPNSSIGTFHKCHECLTAISRATTNTSLIISISEEETGAPGNCMLNGHSLKRTAELGYFLP